MSDHQPDLRGKHLLIVDDIETNRKILIHQSQSWGMLPVAVGSGAEALSALERPDSFDIALLDLHMPEMDGLELAQRMRLRDPQRSLTLVMLTSVGHVRGDPRTTHLDAFLSKPIKASALHQVLQRMVGGAAPRRRSAPVSPDTDLRRSLLPLKILLVEDNRINQKVAIKSLERLGYRIDSVASGAEGLAAVHQRPYDVVLMDVQMPEMDGLEATCRIRAELSDDRQPYIIAMTANTMKGDRERCLDAGMDDYLGKPFRRDELMMCLVRASEHHSGKQAPGERGPDTAVDVVALETLAASLGDQAEAVLPELLRDYLEEAPQLIASGRKALEEEDTRTLFRIAHTLKSTSDLLGVRGLRDLARDLEQHAQDLGHAEVLLNKLEEQLPKTRASIERLLSD